MAANTLLYTKKNIQQMDGCNSCGKINSTHLKEEVTVDACLLKTPYRWKK